MRHSLATSDEYSVTMLPRRAAECDVLFVKEMTGWKAANLDKDLTAKCQTCPADPVDLDHWCVGGVPGPPDLATL